MAISFPLAASEFFTALRVVSCRMTIEEYVEVSGTARGEIIVREVAAPKWAAEISLSEMPVEEARQAAALMHRIGRTGTFNVYDTQAEYPAADPDGSILGSADVTIASIGSGRRSVSLSGLPAGYVLTAGDRFHVNYASDPVRRGYFEIAEGAVADGSGDAGPIDVSPWVKTGITAGLSVDLKRPSARMQFRSFDIGTGQYMTHRSGMTFSAIEAAA